MKSVQRVAHATESLTLSVFCQRVLQRFRPMMGQQGIRLELDVDPTIAIDFDPDAIAPALSAMIEDACRSMPTGGQLQLTVVASRHTVEVEVADSRDGDCLTNLASRRAVKAATGNAIRMSQLWCPQGGLARTLLIPLLCGSRPAYSESTLRRAA